VISYALGLKGRALDMVAANFRTSKFSQRAEEDMRLQLLNIPIPKVHDDFWVFNYLTTAPSCPQEYQDRFAKFRQYKGNMFNIWVPFGPVDWWDLAITSKGSIRGPNWDEEQDLDAKVKNGRGPGKWWYYPNMTGIFGDQSEAMVFQSSNFHSGVRPPKDGKRFGDRQSVECRFIEDPNLAPVSLEEARKASLKISSLLGDSQDPISKKVWELLNSNEQFGPQVYQRLEKSGELPILGQIYQRLDKFSKETSPLQPVEMSSPKVDLFWLWILLPSLVAVIAIAVILCLFCRKEPEIEEKRLIPRDREVDSLVY